MKIRKVNLDEFLDFLKSTTDDMEKQFCECNMTKVKAKDFPEFIKKLQEMEEENEEDDEDEDNYDVDEAIEKLVKDNWALSHQITILEKKVAKLQKIVEKLVYTKDEKVYKKNVDNSIKDK